MTHEEEMDAPVPPLAVMEIGGAISVLGDAVISRRLWDFKNNLKKANTFITRSLGACGWEEDTNLTEEESNLAYCLHTWLRKYEDGPLSSLLYNLIDKNTGTNIWYKFIKIVIQHKESKRKWPSIWGEFLNIKRNDFNEDIMFYALQIWKDGVKLAVEDIETWNKE